MISKLPIGVIGLGRLGYQHALNINTILNAKLVAISDPVKSNMDRITQYFDHVKAYKDYRDLLLDNQIKAVVICSPTRTHAKIAEEAIKAGKYVFCEKPIAFDLKEAELLKEVIESEKGFFQVGFMRRFDRGYAAAKERIINGEIGDPVYFLSISRDPCAPPVEFVKDSGGLFLDMCIHDIDLARWFMNTEIESVFAQGSVSIYDFLKDFGDIDQATMSVKFKNGNIGLIEASRNSKYGYDVRTEIIGTKGTIIIGQWQDKPYIILNSKGVIKETVPWFLERFGDAYKLELKSFVDSVISGKPPVVDAYDGYMAMKVAVTASESFKQGLAMNIT